MDINLSISINMVTQIEEADFILIMGDYQNFTKNKVYSFLYDKYDKRVLMNDAFDYENTPLENPGDNILLSVKIKV